MPHKDLRGVALTGLGVVSAIESNVGRSRTSLGPRNNAAPRTGNNYLGSDADCPAILHLFALGGLDALIAITPEGF